MATNLQNTSVMPKDLTFKLLENITNNFSEGQRVGSGAYGEVYKGVHNGEEIAVKKLYHTPGLVDAHFKKEFNSLMRVQHQNIVRLIGYCYETQNKFVVIKGEYVFAKMEERALCFEYLKRGSLENLLCDESCVLDWSTCYKIIKGICEGLDYLHNASKDTMYHLDLKPANILLDENMTPKIADFGLTRLFSNTQTHHTTKNIIGTVGYMPPEYIQMRHISNKYDVFSLGVIIMRIIAGPSYSKRVDMPSQEFIELVHENWKSRLQTTSTYISGEADYVELKTCMEIALRCVETDRKQRPTIGEVIKKLNEIETVRRSLIPQSCAIQCNKEGFGIDPLEVRFPFELNRENSCVLQLTNRSDACIMFSVRANLSVYSARPDMGIVPPWSRRYVVVTMQAQARVPPDMQCNDMFIVQSTSVRQGLAGRDVTKQLFEEIAGKVMDEVKLPIVYVAVPQNPPRS